MTKIEKTSYEEIFRYHEFSRPDGNGWLSTGEYLSSVTMTATDEAGGDVTSTIIDSAMVSPTNGTKVRYKLKGGTLGSIYTLNIKVVTSAGQKFEDDSLQLTIV
jgi:uncharacterized protein YndB with AHSA1/START domain